MEWDQDICVQLINEYKNKEVLWNPRDPAYYNKVKKDDAWEELSEKFEKNCEELKKKINSLKGSYRREKARAKTRNARIGKGRCKIYKSKWFAFESLQFLEDKDESRKTLSMSNDKEYGNETLDDSKDREVKKEEEKEREKDQIDKELDNPQVLTTEQLTNEIQNKKIKFSKKCLIKQKETDEDTRKLEAFGYMRQAAVLHERKDQCSLFGDYIADKLRTFDNHFRAIAQHRISNILFELEMDLYKKSSTHTSM